MALDTSYLTRQVNSIIGQLHDLFDEIGVPDHDREARDEEVRRYDTRDAMLILAASCSPF